MINGQNFDWEGISIGLPHGTLVNVSKISYGDEKDFKAVYGKGSMPRGFGAGNWKGEGKLTVLREEYEAILAHCQKQKVVAFYRLAPFPITVSYANADKKTAVDRLLQCKFKKVDTSSDQGAEKTDVELEFVILGGIDWNGLPADKND